MQHDLKHVTDPPNPKCGGGCWLKSEELPEGWDPSDRAIALHSLQMLNSCEGENNAPRMVELALLESKEWEIDSKASN